MKKKIISAILLTAMLASTFVSVSCGDGGKPSDATNGPEKDTTTEPVVVLPDYGQKVFTILYRNEWSYEFIAEEETGDLVSDAIYRRNNKVAEDYNVRLQFTGVDGNWNNRDVFDKVMRGSIIAGDNSFDIVAGYQACMVTPAMEGLFLNINDIPELVQSNKWWSEKCAESLTVNDCIYMITGDIALSMWNGLYCVYFNKTLADNYKIGNVYDIVTSGKWTVDKLYELSSLVSDDINGDGKYDENDRFGLVTHSNAARNYIVSFDTPVLTENSDGVMEYTFYNERSQTAADKIKELFNKQSTFKNAKAPDVFLNGQALFYNNILEFATKNRDSEVNFGIIPVPKLDENQKEYYTSTSNGVSMMCFPMTLEDTSMAGTLVEALCKESNSIVVPEYYEKTLKTKGARDDDSQAMIDLIRDSLKFDFGWVHSTELGYVGTVYEKVAVGDNFTSYLASIENQIKSGLERVNEAYAKLNK